MKNFQEKKSFKNIATSRPFLIFLGLLVLFFSWSLFGFFVKMQETTKNKKIAENKLTEVAKNKEKLLSDIDNLKTDKGVEEVIRDKFGLVKDKENVIVVVEKKESIDTNPDLTNKSVFSFIKNWFK